MRNEVQTLTNKKTQTHTDSLVNVQVALMLKNVTADEWETVMDLVVFDTDKSSADSTGQPPVKAVFHKEHRRKQQGCKTEQADMKIEVQATTDSIKECAEQTANLQISERRPEMGMGILRMGMGALLLAVSVFVLRILYRRIKHGEYSN